MGGTTVGKNNALSRAMCADTTRACNSKEAVAKWRWNGYALGGAGSGKPSDVEDPNLGQRPGQLHYQDNKGNKYIYDSQTNSFPGAPKSVNNLLKDPSFKKAIDKRMVQYLGEKK